MVMDYSMYEAHIASEEAVKAGNSAAKYQTFDKIYKWNSVYFGLGAIVVASIINWFKTTQTDTPYWIYTAGVISFWGGLFSMGESGDQAAFKFFLINCVLFLIGGMLQRGIFILAGSAGIVLYVFRLVEKTYGNDPLFSIYIAGAGLLLVLAVAITRPFHQSVSEILQSLAPERLRRGQL
jgi:hypothetical protein